MSTYLIWKGNKFYDHVKFFFGRFQDPSVLLFNLIVTTLILRHLNKISNGKTFFYDCGKFLTTWKLFRSLEPCFYVKKGVMGNFFKGWINMKSEKLYLPIVWHLLKFFSSWFYSSLGNIYKPSNALYIYWVWRLIIIY